MKQKVIILGTDLPALLAGHAAALSGHDTFFVADGEPTAPGGLDFLSRPIPMADADLAELSVKEKGESMFFYRRLRGGGSGKPFNLPFDGADGLLVWDPGQVYEQLVMIYGKTFREGPPGGITAEFVKMLASDAKVFSSVQAPAICEQAEDGEGHDFSWASVVQKPHVANPDGHEIMLSGDLDEAWAIQGSTFFGMYRIYPADSAPPIASDKLVRDYFPLKTNCDCHPEVRRVGRAAAWDSGYQLHRAFYDTMHFLS